MAEGGHGVDDFAVDQDVETADIGELPAGEFVIEGCVAAGSRFEFVGEVRGDFAQGEFVTEHRAETVDLRVFQGFASSFVA